MYRVRSPTGHSASGKCSHRVHSSPEVSEQAAAQGGGKNSRVRDLSDRAQKHYRSREIPNSITQQVQQLQTSLMEADATMSDNEHMLTDYKTAANARRAMEMDEVQGGLHRSREILPCSQPSHLCSTPLSPRLCSSCGDRYGEELDNVQLRSELEREKLARERAEFNSSKAISLLDTSLRSHTPIQPSVNHEEISDQIKELKQDLAESTKKLEENSQQYEQRLKEIDEKIKEGSASPKSEGAFDDLIQKVSLLKDELWQRDASEKRRQMLQQIRMLETDLSSERQRHSSSVHQSRKLHGQVRHLGQELGQLKQEKEQALSCLETTSKHLGQSMDGREELLVKVEELQQALVNSEKQRVLCVEKCGQLSQECFKQEVGQETLREKIKDVEAKMDTLRQDRKSLKARQQQLSQEVAEKKFSETKFREHCSLLEKQLSELVGVVEHREVEFSNMAKKMEKIEKEGMKDKMSAAELRAELKNAVDQKKLLEEKLKSVEEELEEEEETREAWQSEVQKEREESQRWRVKADNMAEQITLNRQTLEKCQQEKKAALANVSKLERLLEESKKKQATSYNNAVQALKKLKLHCEEVEGESIRVKDERDSVLIQHGEVQRLLAECQAQLKNEQCHISQLEKENSDLNVKLTAKGKESDSLALKVEDVQNKIIELEALNSEGVSNYEKSRFELGQSQVDCDNFKQELSSAQKNLEQCQNNEKRLATEVARAKDMWQKEVAQLQSEVDGCRSDRVKMVAKYKRLLTTSQGMKAELESKQVQCKQSDEERRSLDRRLDEVQSSFSRKEQDMLKREQSYKLAQSQETKKLKAKQTQIIDNLQQTISTLELRLADEQSSLQEVRRQQLKVLDDQQKVYADDLSKSLEDTDRVRKKYFKAKKLYQEKAAALESEITEFSGKNESLRQKLSESQTSLMQQLEEYEALLREAAKEVDTIVHQMGLRVDIPMFPTLVGDGTDVKKGMADMLAKLKWLQKEVTDLLTEESKLRNKVNSIDRLNSSRYQHCDSLTPPES